MNELINSNAIKMTSIEIAELVGSRHDKVKQSIERLAVRGVIRNPPMVVFEKINNLGLLRGVEATFLRANKVSATALLSLPSCRRNSPLALLTAGENSKGQPRKYHKPFLRHCALRPTLKTRRLNWRNSLLSQHLKLSLPIALASPAEF